MAPPTVPNFGPAVGPAGETIPNANGLMPVTIRETLEEGRDFGV
jgi:hypothetical protein